MSQGLEPLPSQVGEIHLGMALERVLTCLGNVLFDEFPFVGGTTCIRHSLDPGSSPFESVTYCFAEERLFSVIWENATTDPLASSVARFGPPALRRDHGSGGDLAFVEHRWQQGDVEFIVTDFPGQDGTHSFAVEMCDARVKRGLALRTQEAERGMGGTP
ncbi:MAG: hypothetical protein HYT85_10375 [candidate division NC10 bacterium]|nr:hypothetical protein [candidate division NC10 bacterium]MBI2115474.1 hypothetical protein [candidate division NC10 bacterium]MBI2457290.1 hypothetical protein [candidate division NC10 bacterium]